MSADKLLEGAAWHALVAMFAVVLFTYLAPKLSELEAVIWPVVTDVTVLTEKPTDGGVIVEVQFDKRRQCEFESLSWHDRAGRALRIDFARQGGVTRPTGEQVAGPWKVYGIDTLEGTRAVTTHRCHFLWSTFGHFFP